MSNDSDESAGTGQNDHYQPWLRNQDGGAGSPVSRPQPLPTTPARPAARPDGADGSVFDSMAHQERQRPAAMTADELLAKPIPMAAPQPEGPGVAAQVGEVGRRIGGVLGAFADWTMDLGRKADVPARIARLELGRRSREVGAATARMIGKGAAGTGEAAKAAMDAASRAGDAAAPKIKAAASAAKDRVAKGASAAGAGIGGAARKVADVTPLPTISGIGGIGGKEPAPIESQLDRLLAQEEVAPRPSRPKPALPLFADTADEVSPAKSGVESAPASPTGSTAAGSPASAAPVTSSTTNAAGTPYASVGQSGGTGAPTSGGSGRGSSGGGAGFGSLGEWGRHPATWLLGGLALLGVGFGAGAMWSGPGVNREATERTIHDYLLNNPEIIPQAMEKLQSDRQASAVNRLRERIEQPFSGAWAGAADGDVVLTVFTDYACTFCRASVPDIDRLLREDRKLKVVFRELPILSRDSEPAARLALVAARRGRYMAMHRALFESGSPDSGARIGAAEQLEVPADNAQLNDAAITRELESNIALARELGFDGTPSWVVGDRLLTGAVGYDQLRAAVAAARN